MSLATRCPVCSTVFRVVQDQLKVSEGWVRCGRCAKVFNAFEGLFDLERELATMTAPTVSPSQKVLEDLAQRNRNPKPKADWTAEDFDLGSAARASAHAPLRTNPAAASPTTPVPAVPRAAAPSASAFAGLPAPPPPAAPSWTASKPAPLAADAEPVGLRNDPLPIVPAAEGAESDGSYDSLFQSNGELDAPTAHPSSVDIMLDGPAADSNFAASGGEEVDSRFLSFVQEADKAARWQRPKVRLGLAAAAGALGLVLVAQLAVAQRDLIAALWPQARPLLVALCGPWNCRIEPLRRIERLAVESSGLTRIEDGPIYRLALVLRNRGDTAVMLPSVDLSLTDSGGAMVARRMLNAAELGAQHPTIAAGQEIPLQALLMSSDRPLTGYTIEIFYP